jgi:hypothetical protein
MMDIAAELARVCAKRAKPVTCCVCGESCSTALEVFPRNYYCGKHWDKHLDNATKRARGQ